MRVLRPARIGLSVVAATLIAAVLFWMPAVGGDVPVAHAIPTLAPIPVAVVNVYAAGYPKYPDGSTHFEFWIYNTGTVDALNVKVHTWYVVHSKAGPFSNEYHNNVVLPKVKVGDSEPVQATCYASFPLYCSAAYAQIQPSSGYVIGKGHDLAALSIP